MALLWQKNRGGVRYEVRSAGRSRRLYTDGVLHSQFNPAHGVTGSVWDLLMLPAFLLPQGAVRRVLVLGVGGGSVIHLLRRFVAPETMVGVELEPVHLEVARRFFGIEGPDLTLHNADAAAWVADYRGPRFDLIIDDLFGGSGGEPRRAVLADSRWFTALRRLLAPRGALVFNNASRAELTGCGYFADFDLRRHFAAAFELWGPKDDNRVGAFLGREATPLGLRRRLEAHPALDPRRRTSRLRYRIRHF